MLRVCAGLGTSQCFGELFLDSAFSATLPLGWKVFCRRTSLMQLSYSAWTWVGLWLDVGRIVSRITREFTLPPPRASLSDGSNEEKNIIYCVGLL